jgi:hypothetical protein
LRASGEEAHTEKEKPKKTNQVQGIKKRQCTTSAETFSKPHVK